jgi:tetraacyldisaccharide 4'-kinase
MPDLTAAVAWLWEGRGVAPASARALLAPVELLFRAGVAARGALYDAGIARSVEPSIATVAVGNLTVGGTGKTPIAAWVTGELAGLGARPAIVLRGYGEDEPLVHAVLNPHVPVVVSPDRVAGVREAERRGADVAVLDDAFQHRRLRRAVDLVLVSAEHFTGHARLLPSGPYREPLHALRRASGVIVTRKAASAAEAGHVADTLQRLVPGVPAAVAALSHDGLRQADGTARRALSDLRGRRVLAIAAVGDPASFFAQLAAAGASVDPASFRDHHRFAEHDVVALAPRAARADLVVCTLKDAVKLAPLWGRAASALWYVSQRVTLEREASAIHQLLRRALEARSHATQTAGSRRPT